MNRPGSSLPTGGRYLSTGPPGQSRAVNTLATRLKIPQEWRRFVLIVLPVIGLAGAFIAVCVGYEADAFRRMVVANEGRLVPLAVHQIQTELTTVVSDLRHMSRRQDVVALAEGHHARTVPVLHAFERLLDDRPIYGQLRLLDTAGREAIRVERGRDGDLVAASHDALQDKSDRYYFREGRERNRGELFVSPMDLNVEQGVIERPFNPTIRFTLPIHDSNNVFRFLLVANIRAGPLLERIREVASASYGEFWLLNRDGFPLLGPDPSREWAFMFPGGQDHSLIQRDPGLWSELQENPRKQSWQDGSLVTRVYLCGRDARCVPDSAARESLPFDAPDQPWTIVSRVASDLFSVRHLLGRAGTPLGVLAGFVAVLAIGAGWMAWQLARGMEMQRTLAGDLVRSRSLVENFIETNPNGMAVRDLDGRFLYANGAYRQRALGSADAELVGKTVLDALGESDFKRISAGDSEVMQDFRKQEYEHTYEDPHLGSRTYHCIRFPMTDSAGAVDAIGVFLTDITDRRAVEQQLQQSQKMESIGQLTGGLAHDFNNLLGVIIGNLDLLGRELEGNEKALRRVHTAQRAAERGGNLTRRLLSFARCQTLRPEPTQVNRTIGELLEMLPRTLGPEFKVTAKLAPDLPDALIDPSGLESALLNLSLNARDAMTGGGNLVFTTTVVDLDVQYAPVRAGELCAGQYIRISVSDTGHGIAPEAMEKVFEPFFSTKSRGKGTGLGLAMVYGFVKQSKGNIRIYSEVGAGTTFNLYLPLAGANDGAGARSARRPSQDPASGTVRGTVLVVDDEVDLLEIAVTYCEELGLRVLHATDAGAALDMATQEPELDLLLTDVVMPGAMNGVMLAQQLREQLPDLKVIYCSGFPSSALADRSRLTVDGPLINKPYQRDLFVSTVIDALSAPGDTIEQEVA